MADRWEQFLTHPATMMGAGIMAGSDPRAEGLGGVGQGIMAASDAVRRQQLAELQARTRGSKMGLPDYSKTPTYFRTPEGGYRIGQLSPSGEMHFPEVPEGLEPMRPMTTVDYGGYIGQVPYGAAEPAAVTQKTVPPEQQPTLKAEQTQAATEARMRTERREDARARLPGALIDARRTFGRLNQLRTHDALAAAVGASSWLPVIRGTDRADFVSRMNQITGGAFLQAFETLKGGGQITQIEGEKATQAITRMSEATSEEAFFAAMNDYAEAIQDGILKLQAAAEVEQTGIDIPWLSGGPEASVTPVPANTRKGRRERRQRVREIREKYGQR